VVDDPFVRAFIRTLLERNGYRVVEGDLDCGLMLVRSQQTVIDILITNNPAPFAGSSSDLTVLYVASCPDESLVRPFRRWRTLRKPFRPQQLLLVLEDLLSDEAAAS